MELRGRPTATLAPFSSRRCTSSTRFLTASKSPPFFTPTLGLSTSAPAPKRPRAEPLWHWQHHAACIGDARHDQLVHSKPLLAVAGLVVEVIESAARGGRYIRLAGVTL